MRFLAGIVLAGACFAAAAQPDDGLLPRLRAAAVSAAQSPATWLPLAGAALAAPFDRRIADWSQDHHPLFDDAPSAGARSDDLRDGLLVAAALAAAASPVPEETGWLRQKARTGLALVLTGKATRAATGFGKFAAGRERPDASNTRSFPSGHSSVAFAMAGFADAELGRFDWPAPAQFAVDAGLYGTAALTAWARVEADKHWASDVLAGAALGSFVARFAHAAVLGGSERVHLAVDAVPGAGWSLRLAWSFGG
ncbi:MAG: phosphatase PAP2 family protein [Gammaproteobacteria bacterium]|nr:phosphatase PAP2 family protein [Gammaproteobacteria bacterium]